MRQTRRQYLFHKLKEFIKAQDFTSIGHVLRWEYRKEELFDLKNDEGLTLIHVACFEGQLNCLEIFLRNGASVNIRSSVGWTPLHAATLGGKLEVVEFLLSQCSADPSAKDEMGCVASDLTMDADILATLHKYSDELRIRKQLEKLAALKAEEDATKKRNTFNFDFIETIPTNTSVPTRSRSMIISSSAVRENKLQRNTTEERKQLLDVPSAISNIKRHNSAPPQKNAPILNIDKNTHNQNIVEQVSTCSSPDSPQVTRFSTSGLNRDSGVFDDDTDMDSQTDQLIQKQIEQAQHFKVI